MATKKSGQVTLRGRFPKGTAVRLVKVRDERALRAEGGREVATGTVDEDGQVQFKNGVDVGGRYFVVGLVDGQPLEVRARGRSADDESETLTQAPVAPDRTRRADGTWTDEAPAREKAGFGGVGPAPAQRQVPEGTVQRSDTWLGTAHPHDPEEPAPYPRQEDVGEKTVQRSSTETGQATPVAHDVPVSQAEVKKGTVQRSDTPLGYATPIPKGNAVQAQKVRESAETKASVGEPVKAAALPPDAPVAKRIPDRDPAVVWTDETRELVSDVPPETVDAPGDIDTTPDESGRDPQGQPLAPDVAAAAGIEPAASPSEPVKKKRPAKSSRSAVGGRKSTTKEK